MATFAYKGIRAGVRQEGHIEAESLQAARELLRRDSWVLLDLRSSAVRTSQSALTPLEIGLLEWFLCRVLISKSQWEMSLRQLASLLQAGVPILLSFQALGRQADPLLARLFDRVGRKLRQGQSLHLCLGQEAPGLGRVSLGLIGVGEANGALDEMLSYAAELMEQARKVRGQIIQAFTYPAIVVVGAMGVSYYMVAVVFPKIMVFIQRQGRSAQLPMPTRVLIDISDFMTANGIYVFAAPFVLTAAFFLARRVPGLGEALDGGPLRIPLLGKAFRDHANTMWCRTLGALLRSGVDIITALELTEGTMGNLYYAVQFRKIREVVRQGRSLTAGLQETQLRRLCPMALTMVSVSEESGGLDASLLHVARHSEDCLNRRVALLSKLVEPAIFVVVGGMVGFVYFAFFMAMLMATRSAR